MNTILLIFIDSLGLQISLTLLTISLLFPTWIAYQELYHVQQNNKDIRDKANSLQGNLQESEAKIKGLEEKINKLEANENTLKMTIEKLNGLVFALDSDGYIRYTSQEITSFFDFEKQSIFNGIDLLEDHIHPDDKLKFIQDKHKWGSNKLTRQYRLQLKEKSFRWIELQINPVTDENGQTKTIFGAIKDITNQKDKEQRLKDMAFYDVLTGLPNRIMLKTQLRKAFSRAKRRDHDVTVMFMDLDGFKEVNDKLGHDVGDDLLKEVATRLNNSVREEDLVSRIGGDEFIVVVEETPKDEILGIAERILKEMSVPFSILKDGVTVSPSIGIAIYPEDGETIDSIVERADKAMYYAKNNGKNTFCFYSKELEDYEPKETMVDKILNFFQK